MVRANPKNPNSEAAELKQLLDCAMDHTIPQLQDFLRGIQMPTSGPREDLRDRIRNLLHQNLNTRLALIEYLNLIEGWGKQHLYLYTVPDAHCKAWQKEAHVRAVLSNAGHLDILNHPRPVILPEVPTLSSIRWSPKHVRFLWNEKRAWLEPQAHADKEDPDSDFLYKAFKRCVARGTMAFDWNLVTGDAMVMIQSLPKGSGYESIRNSMLESLKPLVDLTGLEPLRVNKAIKPIVKSNEVRERRTKWTTVKNSQVTFTSSGRKQGVASDDTLRVMESAGRQNLQGDYGNMYWLPVKSGELTEEMHTVIHKKDQRVSVMGEKVEKEVRYVASRIRAHCK